MSWLAFVLAAQAFAVETVHYNPFSYAQAPIEADRWGPPREIHGSLVQTLKSVSCPQVESGEALPSVDEDCLRILVSSPKEAAKAPVIVFFHGGDLRTGSGLSDLYNGSMFARDGVVFISANYRLGPFGFLSKDGETVSRGIQDQISALNKIREQVSGFGGDPENITLISHTSGAYALRQMVNAGLAGKGVRRLILMSPDSSMAKAAYSAVSSDRLSKLNSVSWQEALKDLKAEPLSILPSGPFDHSKWEKIQVLQTVLKEEERSRDRVCDAISFATELEQRTDSFLYMLNGFGSSQGDDVKELFADTGEGERLRSVFLHFIREGKPPPSFFLFRAKPFKASEPKILNLYRWWQYPSALEGC